MQRRNRWRSALVFGLTGWLFADLFIALTMGFVANIVGYPPTPTPMQTVITPTVTPPHSLRLIPIHLTLTVDAQALLQGNGDPSAIASVEQQIKSKYGTALACKLAGFVLTFGGALTDSDIGTALAIAKAVDTSVFTDLGKQNYVFDTARYRDFFSFGVSPNTITADVYVFDNVNTCLSAETGNTLDLAT